MALLHCPNDFASSIAESGKQIAEAACSAAVGTLAAAGEGVLQKKQCRDPPTRVESRPRQVSALAVTTRHQSSHLTLVGAVGTPPEARYM
jgi:hypothetical protein